MHSDVHIRVAYLLKKFDEDEINIPYIVVAYYTLFQSNRMTGQWKNSQEYMETFEQICTEFQHDSRDDYDKIIVNMLLATGFFCLGITDKALDFIKRLPNPVPNLADELMSMCGIRYILSLTDTNYIAEHGFSFELPYALSECGDDNETILVQPECIERKPNLLIIYHGYDCYKMRSWLIDENTILDELKKWMIRLPVTDIVAK